MQLRRALLLFALVLGFAAVAASLTPPPAERRGRPQPVAPAAPRPVPEPPAASAAPVQIAFRAGSRGLARRELAPGRQAVVTVAVSAPGQVEIPALGLIQAGDPSTPAVFDVLVAEPGRYPITFRPPGSAPRRVGVLRVSQR